MYSFFDQDQEWICYALEVLLFLKMLYDRGFDVSRVNDLSVPVLFDFIKIIFRDENFTLTELVVEPPQYFDSLEEESEMYYSISDYMQRDHYNMDIRVDSLAELSGYLRPRDYRKLSRLLNEIATEINNDVDDGEFFSWYDLFQNTSWLKENGKIVGFSTHFVDQKTDGQDPYYTGHYVKVFINFWDQLEKYKKEAKQNAGKSRHYNLKNKPKRKLCLANGRGVNHNRTANRPSVAA